MNLRLPKTSDLLGLNSANAKDAGNVTEIYSIKIQMWTNKSKRDRSKLNNCQHQTKFV